MKGTVKSKDEVERLFRNGKRSTSRLFSVLTLPSPCKQGRCAFIAGKKLGSAPFRNRCKRVMRAAAQTLGFPWAGYDVVFIARSQVATAKCGIVCDEMRKQLLKAGVLRGE